MRKHLHLTSATLTCLALLLGVAVCCWAPAADETASPGFAATLKGHTEAVYAIGFTPDGKHVLTGSFDRTLKMWEMATGKEVKTFAGPQEHQNLVLSLAISPDGQSLASGGSDNTVKVWDIPSSNPLRQFAHTDAVNGISLSPDGTRLAGAGKDGTVKIWNTADGKELVTLKGHTGPVTSVSFSGNGQTLASAGADRTVRFWNVANGTALATVGAGAGPINAVLMNPNNVAAYSAGEDGVLKFWQVPPPAPKPLPMHGDAVTAITLSADGNLIATASADKIVRLTPFANPQQARALPAASAAVVAAALAGNGATVAGGTSDDRLILWNAADGKVLGNNVAHGGGVTAVAFHPASAPLLSGGGDGLLKLWALPLVAPRSLPHPDSVTAAALTADGKRLFTGGADKLVRSWNLAIAAVQPERQFTGHTAAVITVAVSANGQVLASGGADKTVIVWNAADGKEVKRFALPAAVQSVALSPDGKFVAAGLADNSIHLLDPAAGKEVKSLTAAGPVTALVYLPKGDLLISAEGQTVKVWNAADGKEVKTLAAHDGAVSGAGISADGLKIVSAGADKKVKVWALTPPKPGVKVEDKPLAVFDLPAAARSVAISPNGLRVAAGYSGEKENVIRVFDVAGGKELLSLPDHAGAVHSLVFAADNRTLVSTSADKTARLSDVGVTAVWEAHPGGVAGIAYHSNGTQALSGGADKTVKLWDLATGKLAKSFGPLTDPVSAVAFSRDYTQVGAAAGQTVKVWNLADGKELLTLSHPAEVSSLSFSADKLKIVTGAADNLARVWEVTTGKELQSFAFTGPVRSVVFHPNNTTIVAGSADKTAAVHTLAVVRLVAAAAVPLRGLALTPNGSHVLTAANDTTVKMWNLNNGVAERTFAGAEGAVHAVAVSKNNVLVAVGGADKQVRLYTLADAKQVGTLAVPAPVRGLAFTPNSLTLAAACEDKSLLTWNVTFNPGQPPAPDFGKPMQSFAHAAAASDVVFAPDNFTLYSGSADKTTKAWKLAADVPRLNLPHPNMVDSVAFNPAGTQLATGCHDGIVRIFDALKGTPVKQINAHTMPAAAAVYCVAWSPDGKQLVSGSLDQTLKLWDVTAGTMVRTFKAYKLKEFEKGHREGVFCIAWSPDGKTIASGSSDRTIKIWNVADGMVLRDCVNPSLKPVGDVPVAHPGWVYGLRFTPDGKYLFSAGPAPQNKGFLAGWQTIDGKLIFAEELPTGAINALALAPDGKLLGLACGPQGRQAQEVSSFLLKVPEVVK